MTVEGDRKPNPWSYPLFCIWTGILYELAAFGLFGLMRELHVVTVSVASVVAFCVAGGLAGAVVAVTGKRSTTSG